MKSKLDLEKHPKDRPDFLKVVELGRGITLLSPRPAGEAK